MKTTILLGVVIGISFRLLMLGLGPTRLRMDVTPRVCTSPCDVRVFVRVLPDEDNRKLTVSISGDRYESTTETQLEGLGSPLSQPYLWFKGLPEGLYTVAAVLQTSVATVAHVEMTVEVR